MVAGHAHSIITDMDAGERHIGTTSYSDGDPNGGAGHSHDWVMDEIGNVIVGDAHGHNHMINVMLKGGELVKALSGEGASASPPVETDGTAANQSADTLGDSSEGNMAKPEETAAEKAANEKLAEMEKRAERAEKMAELSDAQKALFADMSEQEREQFLGKSAEERNAAVTKAAEGDPVVYTAKDKTEFRKSDDPRLVKMAQRADAAEEAAETARVEKADAEYAKRADVELAHLPGESKTRAAVLKALDTIEDEELRKAAVAAVKANDAGIGAAMETHGAAGDPSDGTPAQKLDVLAKAKAKQDSIPYGKAYLAVIDTPEGEALYNEHAGS
jgi:hypothetical protein